MDAAISTLICFLSSLLTVYSVPPDVCFHQFKWEDCGQPPKAVIYYYKSGSRCEVGMWRGCLPNQNMFADEYECVQTCVFSVRPKGDDFHRIEDNAIMGSAETTPAEDTPENTENTTDGTTGADGGTENEDGKEEGDATGAATGAGDKEGETAGNTDGTAADAAETTQAPEASPAE